MHSVPILQNVFPLVKMPKLQDVELEGKVIEEEEYRKELKELQKRLRELHNRVYRKRRQGRKHQEDYRSP